jgi:ABC-2 type transport system permease protein
VFGLFAGGLSGLVVTATETDPGLGDTLRAFAGGADTVTQALISAMFEIVGVIAAACAVQAVIRARQEEATGTAELLLSTPVARVRWFADYLVVGAVAIALVLVTAAAASSAAVLTTGDDDADVRDSFMAAAAQLPAALAYLGAIALVFVLLPGATAGAGWALLGAGAFVGLFGGLVGIPDWLRGLSPFSHIPYLLSADVDLRGGQWVVAVGIAAASAALALMGRRELRG